MIRFRTLMFLLSMTVLTALASYSFFEPFTQGKIPQAVLDVNGDTNPYFLRRTIPGFAPAA